MPTSTSDVKEAIRAKALALGFDAVGFARPEAPEAARRLREFLQLGRHGDMDWLAAKAERRADPKALWPAVRSVVLLGLNYGPDKPPAPPSAGRAAISVYAQGRDYHDLLKRRLKALGRWLVDGLGADVKVFVDTAPVLEKPLAQAAGLGWQGKHTNLVSRGFGSWLFLGAVFTALKLEPDTGEVDRCGSCRRCLEACPTEAFPAPYQLDARRCISYLTIEHRGHIAPEFRAAIGARIYGCDDCLAVCPWNKYAALSGEAQLWARAELAAPALADLAALDDAAFRAVFAGSPIKRTGRDRFVRNVLIAIGNGGDAGLAPSAERLLDDPSPLVRAMAVWALRRLLPEDEVAPLRAQRAPAEPDPEVRAEWGGSDER